MIKGVGEKRGSRSWTLNKNFLMFLSYPAKIFPHRGSFLNSAQYSVSIKPFFKKIFRATFFLRVFGEVNAPTEFWLDWTATSS